MVFRKNPPNWKDLLDVLVGRVRVHIEHFGNVPNPNRVLTPTAVISVRGTTFDITVDDDDENTLVEVEDGQVEVQHALLPRGNSKLLSPGESLRVYRNEPIAAAGIDKGNLARIISALRWQTRPSQWRRTCRAREEAVSAAVAPPAALAIRKRCLRHHLRLPRHHRLRRFKRCRNPVHPL